MFASHMNSMEPEADRGASSASLEKAKTHDVVEERVQNSDGRVVKQSRRG